LAVLKAISETRDSERVKAKEECDQAIKNL
jgi:hypothetical protein